MTTITEKRLTFAFPEDYYVTKYDEWEHYKIFQNSCNLRNKIDTNEKGKNGINQSVDDDNGSSGVDIIALHESTLWLIEIKDYYRLGLEPNAQSIDEKLSDLPYLIARKIRDSLAGLVSAKFKAAKQEEKDFSRLALDCNEIKIVLHIEMPSIRSKLYPSSSDLANLLKDKFKLSEFTKNFANCYAEPIFTNISHINNPQLRNVPWSVSTGTEQKLSSEQQRLIHNPMTTIYNTLTRQKEPFAPIDPENVRMYVCGMTVYDYCHLGHARVMVVFDMIARWLRECGYPLTYVRNITDIDDKIIARAAENGETIGELTARFIQAMHEDADALGVLRPDIEPKATENIPQMIAMIETLIQNGKAYPAANGDVYYAVREFAAYGQLSGKSLDDLRAGERVEVDGFKRDPLDFVLWKAAKAGEPAWESPWGNGRPGWHIECSAMSENLFGDTFDIHGGGADLQFPHHENEIAQSVGASGHTCGHDHAQTHHGQSIASHVKYWLHNGFIRVDGEKMSKSLGNFFTIREVLKQYDPEVVRFFILRAHYRSPLNYSDAHLDDAKGALTRLYTTLKNTPPADPMPSEADDDYTRRFYVAMNDDFDTVKAVAVLFELAGEVNKTNDAQLAGCLKALGGIIGLLQRDPTEFLQGGAASDGLSNEEIEDLIARRKQARSDKNWAESDRIRDLLNEHKIILEDNAGGTTWRRG
ncbi:cysteinyl-tRNA synthetase [Neisseria meningitidis]|uniref:Cysteine--tRNA ligase n=7 Tax=Pseudomonadota TaxID=1224 RepID=A1KWG0_NEIMF|nr:Cysteine--tRNA ligase [Neisseria meningitidis]CAM11217.1 cysteinyl-tRNA synthetase [Neisseria meningitidis FAM18]ANW94696.1 cysteinyl-tRNA synthetase [Neisseria meningitidis]CWM47348.1 cysteinyl-tRNA synthetase [Neisseria meningitidis]CWM49026.1 cysteinyl-tRNA synthetase [Neisseria meningitidis]